MRKISKKKIAWSRFFARKGLNIRNGVQDFHSDDSSTDDGWSREVTDGVKSSRSEATPANDSLNLRMFVGTWNVGGKSPCEGLNLRDQLNPHDPVDIYVLGFQEIVPLNAGNVLGAEDSAPVAKWLSLIQQALNDDRTDHVIPQCCENPNEVEHMFSPEEQASLKSRVSLSDMLLLENDLGKKDFERLTSSRSDLSASSDCLLSSPSRQRYFLIASKQMVGIFLCVWVQADLRRHISNSKVSCVGRGIMGCLGNKGSISMSMTLHQTLFCFVCTHLASGEKEGDEIRRNSDVCKIFRRTRFSGSCRDPEKSLWPKTILEHDNVIWLGDLNYRLEPGFEDTHELLKKNDWQALLEKDQLRREQRAGRVFKGWEEGKICFAPTYKYVMNSDLYVAQTSRSKEKRRTPAWCDRILWKGQGLEQMWYERGESKFSDHRPVFSLFLVRANVSSSKNKPNSNVKSTKKQLSSTSSILQSTCVAKIQAEELFVIPKVQTCDKTD